MNAIQSHPKFMAVARARSGVALSVIVLVLFLVAVIAFGLVELARAEGVVATRNRQHLQALNLAEAGVHWAVAQLRQNPLWKEGQIPLGMGTADVAVADAPEKGDNWVLVSSTGTVGQEHKTILQYVKAPPVQFMSAIRDYAVYWPNPEGREDLTINNHSHVVGPVFANGNLFVSRHGSVTNGLVYCTATVSGTGTYEVGALPDPLPAEPPMITTYYDQRIAFAATQPEGNLEIDGFSYDLGGATLYVNGNVNIKALTLSGGGRIVATGNILVQGGVEVTDGLDLFAGKELRIVGSSKHTEFLAQRDNVLFATEKITLNNHAYVYGQGLLLTPGHMELDNLCVAEALCWADTFSISNHSTVYGVVHADAFLREQLDNHTSVVHDVSKLPQTALPGMALDWDPGAAMELGAWTEN